MGSSKKRSSTAAGLNLPPMPPNTAGEGLPYAPENWPEPGDTWGWRTGKRLQSNGCYQDRYLYSPVRFSKKEATSSRKHRHTFASKLSCRRFLESTFPCSNIDAFFDSFAWMIPALNGGNVVPKAAGGNVVPIAAVPLRQVKSGESGSDGGCKAWNKMCDSLNLEVVEQYSPAMPCDICCSESRFCRDCTCILCCKTVSSDHGSYSYIKCRANAGQGICGHVAHVECAIRTLLAGTVGESVGLDAEYHCRRCDGRTDLIPHVERLLLICKAVDLDDESKKKVLDLGACILRGSKKPFAKEILNCVELAIKELQGVTNGEVTKESNNLTAREGLPDHGTDPLEVTTNGGPSNDYRSHSLKFDAEVDEVLEALRKSQELEFKMAEERLHKQKVYLQNLYEQLDSEISELELHKLSNSEALSHAVGERKDQISRELAKFEEMKKIASGFGRTPKHVLKEQFGLQVTD